MYEPRTYSVSERESSKLPAIMCAMTFMLGAACYGIFILTGQVHDQFGILQKLQMSRPVIATAATKPTPTKVATSKALSLKSAQTNSRSTGKSTTDAIPAPPPVTIAEVAPPRAASKHASSRSSQRHEQTQTTHSSHSPRGEFFVPPPPPMAFNIPPAAKGFVPPPPPTPYTIPTGIPAAFDPHAGLLALRLAQSFRNLCWRHAQRNGTNRFTRYYQEISRGRWRCEHLCAEREADGNTEKYTDRQRPRCNSNQLPYHLTFRPHATLIPRITARLRACTQLFCQIAINVPREQRKLSVFNCLLSIQPADSDTRYSAI